VLEAIVGKEVVCASFGGRACYSKDADAITGFIIATARTGCYNHP